MIINRGYSTASGDDVDPHIRDCAFAWVFQEHPKISNSRPVTSHKNALEVVSTAISPPVHSEESELSPKTQAKLNAIAGGITAAFSGTPVGIVAGVGAVVANLLYLKYHQGSETKPEYLIAGAIVGTASAITQIVDGAFSFATSVHVLPKVGPAIFDKNNTSLNESVFGGLSGIGDGFSQMDEQKDEYVSLRTILDNNNNNNASDFTDEIPERVFPVPVGKQSQAVPATGDGIGGGGTKRYYKDAISRYSPKETISFGAFSLSFSPLEYDKWELEKMTNQMKVIYASSLRLAYYNISIHLSKINDMDTARIIAIPIPISIMSPYSFTTFLSTAQPVYREAVTVFINVTPERNSSTVGDLLFEIAKNLVIHFNAFNQPQSPEEIGVPVSGYYVVPQAALEDKVDQNEKNVNNKMEKIRKKGLVTSVEEEQEADNFSIPDEISELLKLTREGLLSYSEFQKIKKARTVIYGLQLRHKKEPACDDPAGPKGITSTSTSTFQKF